MLYLVYAFIDSPKEKLLKRKYEEVLTQYSLLSNKVEHLDNVLKDMESRDDNIYRDKSTTRIWLSEQPRK